MIVGNRLPVTGQEGNVTGNLVLLSEEIKLPDDSKRAWLPKICTLSGLYERASESWGQVYMDGLGGGRGGEMIKE